MSGFIAAVLVVIAVQFFQSALKERLGHAGPGACTTRKSAGAKCRAGHDAHGKVSGWLMAPRPA